MSVKLFVLGRPGSGKSSVVRYLESVARDEQWSALHLNDYEILRAMFVEDVQQDTAGHRFTRAQHGGFNVLDLAAFDEALQQLERAAEVAIAQNDLASAKGIALIEFSRNNYRQAFQQFHSSFLQDAFFLYLHADMELCKQRVAQRIANRRFKDDYYVSDYVFERYYHSSDGEHLAEILQEEYGMDRRNVLIIDNNASLEEAAPKIFAFVQGIFQALSDTPALYNQGELCESKE